MTTFSLPYGQRVEVNPESRVVVTHYASKTMGSTREPTLDNCREAEAEGYTPDAEGCWAAVVEHEILHAWLSAQLWRCPSYVVRHETGAEPTSYAVRLYEEAVVLAFQRFMNRGDITLPIKHIPPGDLTALAVRFRQDCQRQEAA